MIRILLFLMVGIFISGCVSTSETQTIKKNIHIIDVTVEIDRNVETTPTFQYKFRNALMNYAEIYNQTQTGRVEGYILHVNVLAIHYKNPIISVLVGDANSITTQASLIDPVDNTILKTFKTISVDGASALLNGISGAILSIAVKKELADETLIKGISPRLMRSAYSTSPLNPKLRQQVKGRDIFAPVNRAISPISPPSILSELLADTPALTE